MAGKLILRWVKRAKLNVKLKNMKDIKGVPKPRTAARKSMFVMRRKPSRSALKFITEGKPLQEYDDIVQPAKAESVLKTHNENILSNNSALGKSSDSSHAILRGSSKRGSKQLNKQYNISENQSNSKYKLPKNVKNFFTEGKTDFEAKVIPSKKQRIQSNQHQYEHARGIPTASPIKNRVEQNTVTPMHRNIVKLLDSSIESFRNVSRVTEQSKDLDKEQNFTKKMNNFMN